MKERSIIFTTIEVQATLAGRKTQFRRPVKPQPSCFTDIGEWGGIESSGIEWKNKEDLNCIDDLIEYCPFGDAGDELWVRETWQIMQSYYCYQTLDNGVVVPDDCIDSFIIPERMRDVYNDNESVLFYKADDLKQTDIYQKLSEKLVSIGYDIDNVDVTDMNPKLWWRPSVYMPRWASRIQLTVKNVRVERVQNITKENIEAEGIVGKSFSSPINGLPYEVYTNSDLVEYTNPTSAFSSLWNETYAKKGLSWDDNPWVWVVEFEVRG